MIYEYANKPIQGFAVATITYPRGVNQIKSLKKKKNVSLLSNLILPQSVLASLQAPAGVETLLLCVEEHQRNMLFSSTWEIDMGMMEIASFTDPCEEHFHIFMPSSFPLKAVKGGLWILHGTQRLMRSPLCVKMDQWNKTRKLLAELRRTPE